ncbi:hypothetical protein NDU88_003510 [Pleurodeles waltl]|uniref:GIY-YIG domain-containing protein n=1 Tax=Pleurodeles waltl TaxID=8319 RepID=A0AAV7VFZ3_PLEWA|nr:hypothetical protein NDU88_003510 [Pleurodeles waltl]
MHTQVVDLGERTPWCLVTHTNCRTKNCIFMITCPCSYRYIGMTTRMVKTRINEHRSTLRCQRASTKLTKHFIESQHTPDDLRWAVLERITSTKDCTRRLFEKEQHWVFNLETHRSGLNDDIPWLEFTNQ